MASKGRVPPPHIRRPLPGPDPYASAIRPPPGSFPHFEQMLPPHELMEQKLSQQHAEIEKLATENRRLAGTHGTLRQDLAAANHELQAIHAHIADVKSEKEQQMRGVMDKIKMMESELESAGPVKMELQKARGEAQSLVDKRKELITKVQQLTRELQMAHSEAQQIPPLLAELDSMRHEYQHCRATYDYEKKLYNDHLESLQVMEKNYMAMSREVEKLRAELTNTANFDPRTGGQYSGAAGYNESIPAGNYASAQNAYGVAQGQSPHLGGSTGAGPTGAAGNSPHVVAQSATAGPGTIHDAPKGPNYSVPRGTPYDPQQGQVGAGYNNTQRVIPTGPSYDSQRGPTGPSYNNVPAYETQRGGPGYNNNYDARKGSVYDGQRAPAGGAYDMHGRGLGDEVQRGANYEGATTAIASVGPPTNNVPSPYGSATPAARGGAGYDSGPRGGNTVRR